MEQNQVFKKRVLEQVPMAVEIWVQTEEPYISDNVKRQEKINSLKAKTEEYKSIIALMSNSRDSSESDEINQEEPRYRILATAESNDDIEIAVANLEEIETGDINISPAQNYTVQTSAPAMVQQIYGQRAYEPLSPDMPSTSRAALSSLVGSKSHAPLTPKATSTPKRHQSAARARSKKTSPQAAIKSPTKKNIMISIGPNDTLVNAEAFASVDWKTTSTATRKLLSLVFDRETLATHSMTGKQSPAFKEGNKPVKKGLKPSAIQDIIYIVSRKCSVAEKEVRNAITTKCADENKMWKLRLAKEMEEKRSPLKEANRNRENDKENNKKKINIINNKMKN